MKIKEPELTGKKPFTTPKLTVYGNMSSIVKGHRGGISEPRGVGTRP